MSESDTNSLSSSSSSSSDREQEYPSKRYDLPSLTLDEVHERSNKTRQFAPPLPPAKITKPIQAQNNYSINNNNNTMSNSATSASTSTSASSASQSPSSSTRDDRPKAKTRSLPVEFMLGGAA